MKLGRPLISLLIGIAVAVALAAVGFRSRSARSAPLDELTKDELYEQARAADIPGRSSMTKEELIRALRSVS